MKGNRDEVFAYIFSKADEVGFMGFDSAKSGKFQDELENDPELIRLAGEKLSRKYIKDTILNNYSKKRRYISEEDVLSVFIESEGVEVLGEKRDLENGIFFVLYDGKKFESTSSSINEWQTVLKRFGKKNNSNIRFSFLTCGGVEKNRDELDPVIDILNSYGVKAFIVKPTQASVSIKSYIKKKNSSFISLSKSKLSKPFLLLAGISGTGKTRFVREQAASSNRGRGDNYCLVPVRPDWHEPSDLLGYVSRLGEKPEYVATDVLRFIVQAWKEIIKSIEPDKDSLFHDWRGNALHEIRPFWLCLDEMNLAPVEQYFSDYLSILETRCWNDPQKLEDSGRDYIYECDPLIKGELFRALDKDIDVGEDSKPSDLLAKDLGLDLSEPRENDIWQYFLTHGIAIPFNLIVAGTVNMDETTHGFSRKVIDRALTFDFGEFFPNDIDAFFESDVKPKTLSYPVHSQATMALFEGVEADKDSSKTKAFFKAINGKLRNTPFELAFRAFNELCLSVISFAPKNDVELAAVFDDFLMCKVLPRIEGDEDKLTSNSGDNVLVQLSTTLETQLASIWQTTRPDLLREKQGSPEDVLTTPCRSRQKIERMKAQLNNGFTSFWP